LLDEGKFGSVIELADSIGMERSYMRRILRLTLLAPDIIEVIMHGREPAGLTLNDLLQTLPAEWEGQREFLLRA
jgi:hypothetical protein